MKSLRISCQLFLYHTNKYIKVDGRWFCTEMSLTYLRGEGNIKKRLSDCANAYKVFLM